MSFFEPSARISFTSGVGKRMEMTCVGGVCKSSIPIFFSFIGFFLKDKSQNPDYRNHEFHDFFWLYFFCSSYTCLSFFDVGRSVIIRIFFNLSVKPTNKILDSMLFPSRM